MRSPDADTTRPLISVVMANYEAGPKLDPAMASVLGQTIADIEVLVCDDASGDDSLERIARFAAADPRVRLIPAEANGGPAQARNRGLEAARGEWIAIVDADDILHPERFERLLAAARHFGADIVADDLLHFHEDGSPSRLLLGPEENLPFRVTIERWLSAGTDGSPPLGYLKPLIRADRLAGIRYDTTLRIGEDFDLVLRLIHAGAEMWVVPEPFYLYRRHKSSISYRLSARDMQSMFDSHKALAARLGPLDTDAATAFAARGRQLADGLAYEYLVEALKTRRPAAALSLLVCHPHHLARLWRSFTEGRQRRQAPVQTTLPAPSSLTLSTEAFDLPAYVPPGEIDWNAPRPRQLWVRVADLGRAQPIDVACRDRAGAYAAGFIPLARIIRTDAVPELAESAP